MNARDYFLSLVCGLAAPKRNERLFCMLNGYFDASTEQDNALIFAGYIGRAADWLRFSAEWEELLPNQPRRQPFKMKVAARTKMGMERAMFHYRIIERSPIAGIGCAVQINVLKKVIKELNIDPVWANPYHLAWRIIITAALEGAKQLGSSEPIKFIFDDQSDKKQLRKTWEPYIETGTRRVRKMIVGEPSFENDDFLNPLQAADLLAWWARRQYVKDATRMRDLFPPEWTQGKEPMLFFVDIPEEGIRTQFLKDIEATKRRKSELRLSATFRFVPSSPKKEPS